MVASNGFASTFVGAYLIPLAVALSAVTIVALWSMGRKILRHLEYQDQRSREQDVELANIKAEVHPNGGSSLRDSINRIEAEQQKVAKGLRRHVRDTRSRRDRNDEMFEAYSAWKQQDEQARAA